MRPSRTCTRSLASASAAAAVSSACAAVSAMLSCSSCNKQQGVQRKMRQGSRGAGLCTSPPSLARTTQVPPWHCMGAPCNTRWFAHLQALLQRGDVGVLGRRRGLQLPAAQGCTHEGSDAWQQGSQVETLAGTQVLTAAKRGARLAGQAGCTNTHLQRCSYWRSTSMASSFISMASCGQAGERGKAAFATQKRSSKGAQHLQLAPPVFPSRACPPQHRDTDACGPTFASSSSCSRCCSASWAMSRSICGGGRHTAKEW